MGDETINALKEVLSDKDWRLRAAAAMLRLSTVEKARQARRPPAKQARDKKASAKKS
jgi:hypothetical protein